MKSKKWIIAPVTAAMLAVGAIGSISAYAETPPPATPPAATPPAPGAPAAEAAEPTTGASDVAEANEPTLPGGGHADADGTNVDNQFEGIQ